MKNNVFGHLESLKVRHSHLEKMIFEENHRPKPDDELLHDLKKRRLKLKEEIDSVEKVSLKPSLFSN